MKLSFITLLTVWAVSLNAQQKVQERELSHFDKIKITNEVAVYLTRGEKENVRIEVSGMEPNDVITEVTAKTLEVTLKRGVYKDVSVAVYITYLELRDIFVSSSGKVSIQSVLEGDKIVLNAHTNAQIDAEVNLRTLDAMATKGALIRLKGKLGSYEATISSAANLSALELQADSAFIKVNSKGIAKVRANVLLEASVRSGSTLSVTGNPKTKNIKTGLGAKIIEQ